MNTKKLSIILILSLILSTLFSCQKPEKKEIISTIPEIPEVKNEINPYYSITTQYASHRVNYFMDVDIKIPKITYTGVEKDELFDSINDELYNNITKLVKDAMNESLDVYTDYLETAKSNVLAEQENRMRGLKTKYKYVIGEKEISAINETIENLKIVANENKNNTDKLNEVNGFSSTEGLIIPELHNKNIIIVETTEASSSEVNNSNNISPFESNRANFSDNERPKFGGGERPNRASNSNIKKDVKTRASESNINKKPTLADNSTVKKDIKTRASESNINKELTLADFYDEFAEILNTKVPDEQELTKVYTPTVITCNFDVKCLDEDYLSLLVELDVTKTVSNITRLFYNIDLREKKIINIKDVLGDNYKEICINSINESINKMTEGEKKNLNSGFNIENLINESTNFFINNNHIPVVELDKYTITPNYLEFQIIK